MPGSNKPIAQLGSELLGLLLPTLLALVLAGLVAALLASRAARRQRAAGLLGSTWWGAGPAGTTAHQVLRISLGLLWIVDGLLQAQPRMPAGFVSQVIEPGMAAGPSWLAELAEPLTRVWLHHPVTADAATVWIQLGLGVLILIGGRGGRLELAVLWASVAWSVFIWVVGEFLGGIAQPGASWLMGSPGAVLVYPVMALLLLAGRGRSAATMARWCRRAGACWLLAGAVLQAVPWEGNWTADGLADPFRDGSQSAQPAVLLDPIRGMLNFALANPVLLNGILLLLLAGTGIGLWLSPARPVLLLAILICLATWWLAQDFGVIGGYGTDPNTALPVALLLLAGWPPPEPSPAAANQPISERPAAERADRATATPARAGLAIAGIAAVLAVPLLLTISLLSPADATAVAADSGGGLRSIPHRAAPEFSLPDQHNQQISMASARGKLTLVTFLDPVCSDDCPVIANQIAAAIRQLGSAADQVEVIAIDSNPLFYQVSDVAAFSSSHGLDDLPSWHFVAGSEPALRALLDSYGIAVQVPSVGMIAHDEGIYFIDRAGQQVGYLGDGANPQLSASYATVIGDEIRKLLK